MKKNKEDSLFKRYFYKLLTGIIGLPTQLIIQSIIPRALGSLAYGQFTFLSNSFTQITGFFNSGFSYAYYTKLSSDLDDKDLIKFFFRLVLIFILIIFLGTTGILLLEYDIYIWPDQEVIYIYMAFIWSILNFCASTLNKTIDAYGLTKSGEIIKIVQKIFSLFLISGLYFFFKLDLFYFFIYHYIIIIFLILGNFFILNKSGINVFKFGILAKNKVNEFITFFWNYSHPMISYSFIGMIVGLLDYWFLQKFSGSTELGYFGLSFRIASVCFIFTGAMVPLLMREFSVSFSNLNISQMRYLFLKNIPLLYVISATISIFLFINAKDVTQIIGGDGFKEAGYSVALMSLYPIHQTYGQISSSLFMATNQTVLYRNIGIFMMVLGLILSFFLIAPEKFYGMNYGSLGLVIKMLIMQIFVVNVQLFYNSKYLKFNFIKLVGHQLIILIIFFLIAYSSKYLSNFIFESNLLSFLLSGVIYIILIFIMIYKFPNLISFTKTDIINTKIIFFKKIKQIFTNIN